MTCLPAVDRHAHACPAGLVVYTAATNERLPDAVRWCLIPKVYVAVFKTILYPERQSVVVDIVHNPTDVIRVHLRHTSNALVPNFPGCSNVAVTHAVKVRQW